MSWSATAPSNIALIKYMGKVEPNPAETHSSPNHQKEELSFANHLSDKDKEDLYFKNIGLNASLSYTLDHFITKVQIQEADKDSWSSFNENPFQNNKLYSSSKKIQFENKISEQAQKKFLDFFQFLKRCFLISGNYTIFSQNNFPTAIGAASSASSFAALTLATYELAKDKSSIKDKIKSLHTQDLACLSRVGSGSSCRSFFSTWCVWTGKQAKALKSSWNQLLHQLIIIERQPKSISSSQAHQMVKTSPHFKNRTGRANKRMKSLFEALNRKDWEKCFKICYEEFLDLHLLFETASPSFKYKTNSSQKVLNCLNEYWKDNKDGPLVTMDAGANIHLLYRPDQYKQREQITDLLSDYPVLSSLTSNNNYTGRV